MPRLTEKGGLLFATVSVPFKNQDTFELLDLVVDTGAFLSIVDTSLVDYLGYSAADALKKSVLDGAAGRSEGYLIKVPNFKCLGFEIPDFQIACHDMNTRLGVAGILGMNFLKLFRIDLNYNTGEIYLMEKIIPASARNRNCP